ncbi:outer membrane beta-barrel family protein [Sphingobacterium corticibacter]|nr:outer membrane beta-barrel family protein [Sphingobacterium corticibacter]
MGGFIMKGYKDRYKLKISTIGTEIKIIDIYLSEDYDLGEIEVNSSFGLENITVNARKNLIERKVDRIVFNIEESPSMQGFDLLEALSNTPMLHTSDGGISIVGKSGVAVMINERLINLSGSELIQYLKSLRSDDVAKIEVITTPPSKYDAQGNSGLINIVLKKRTNNGLQSTLSSSYIQRTYGSTVNNVNLNYQTDNLLLSVGLRHYDIAYRVNESVSLIGIPTSVIQSDLRKDFNKGGGLNVNLDYKISKTSNIGFIYDGSIGGSNMDIVSTTNYMTNRLLDSILWTNAEHRKSINFQTLSAYYDLKLDTLGRKVSIMGNFLSNTPRSPFDFTSENLNTENSYSVRNESDMSYQVFSGQVDFTYPTKVINLEIGIKYTDIRNSSFVKYLNLIDEEYVIDPVRNDEFNYKENNYAGYISGFRQLSKKLTAQAGVRYEFTEIMGFSPNTEERNTFNYDNFFPSGYMSFAPNNKHTFSLSYSRRINRPNFGNLNPFRWYSNPYIYSAGNPNLLPSFNNNFELGYVYGGDLSITMYNQRLTNGYTSLTFLENTIQISNWENHLTQYNSGLNIGYSFKTIKWLQSYLFSDAVYIKSKSSIEDVIAQKGFTYYYQINNSIFLNKSKTNSILLNYWQNLPRRASNASYKTIANLRLGINVQVLDKKLQMHLIVEDIFKQNLSRGEIYFQDNTQFFNNYYDARRLTIGAAYRFGKPNIKTNRKDTKFDERGRAN